MPLVDPVLSLAVENISKIDKVDCEKLSSLWTVFTKCAENLENGRRLENLSWRLWYRECRLLDQEKASLTHSSSISSDSRGPKRQRLRKATGLAPLSNSALPSTSESTQHPDPPVSGSFHCKAQHLTPDRFHELVTQFGQEQPMYQEWKGPCEPTGGGTIEQKIRPRSPAQERATIEQDLHDALGIVRPQIDDDRKESLDHVRELSTCREKSEAFCSVKTRGPDVSSSAQTLRRASSVVHGFNPSCVSTKVHSFVEPMLSPLVPPMTDHNKSMFFIESSPSESENEATDTQTRSDRRPPHRRSPVYTKVKPCPTSTSSQKKHTSFREIVDEGLGYESSPFDSDDEDDDTEHVNSKSGSQSMQHESAIVTDDESDSDIVGEAGEGEEYVDTDEEIDSNLPGDDDEWDSVCSESRVNSPQNGNLFGKMEDIDTRPTLVSRKSMLSTLLTNPIMHLSNAQSKSSPAIAQSRRPSLVPSSAMRPANHLCLTSSTEAGATTATAIDGAVSPRSTRRNMLATELSESLRRHLLWERKQKAVGSTSATSQAVLKRRHTALDLTNMQALSSTNSSSERQKALETFNHNEFGYNGAGW